MLRFAALMVLLVSASLALAKAAEKGDSYHGCPEAFGEDSHRAGLARERAATLVESLRSKFVLSVSENSTL